MHEMKHKPLIACFGALTILGAILPTARAADGISVFATGFNNPRGLKFGPDESLYVAEAGLGGSQSTAGQCAQVPGPPGGPGPYTGGPTARISKVSRDGKRTTVVEGLPSSINANKATQGIADIAFIGEDLYALVSGGGCSHGNPQFPAGVIRVNRHDSSVHLVANLGAFFAAHPVAHPDLDDFEPDGTLFSLIAAHERLYAIEPNQGRLLEINPENGKVRQLADLSADPWIGPTGMAYDGTFHVGTLRPFPIVPGSASILEISKRGKLVDDFPGFTAVTGLALSHDDRVYVLELSTMPGRPVPGAGKLVVSRHGEIKELVNGLTFPAGDMAFGSDGALYLPNFSSFAPPEGGQIVRVGIESREDARADID
jgi:hypothetical protein